MINFKMFTLYKWTSFISHKIHQSNKLFWCCYFSANSVQFLKKVKILEKLKTCKTFSPSLYEPGQYILFFKREMVCLRGNDKLVFLDYKGVQNLQKLSSSRIVLLDVLSNSDLEICLFAVNLENLSDSDKKKIEYEIDGKFKEVKHSLYFLNQKDSQYVIQSRGLLHFNETHNFCSLCGGNLKATEGGYQKHCQKCNHTHYPNLAPIGLTLIEDASHEEVLLVRQQRHPPGMYTCVAGFIEPGESLEENVKREVAEEVGLEVVNVEYVYSQHWAMPSCQLTLGCIATACTKNAEIDVKEILDAKWVKAEDLKNAVNRVRKIKDVTEMDETKLWAPQHNAASHHVMVTWLKKYHNFELLDES